MNYPLIRNRKTNILQPTHSSYSDEYARKMCELYLSDEIHSGQDGHMHKFYRLHAKQPHGIEDALAYDVKCPCCGRTLKQIGRMLDCYDLGLYRCQDCDKN